MRGSVMAFAFALAFVFALGGCSSDDDGQVLAPMGVPAPLANSPQGALRRLEWAYDFRSIEVYRELFTGDYRFVFAALDSNGNAYRARPFTRDDDIESTTNLFNAATDIRLDFDRNLIVVDDPRPGRDPGWHKSIRTTVSLMITNQTGDVTTVEGMANFFLVHEDSANVPLEFQERFALDPEITWFIERWEDETDQPGLGPAAVAAPQPISSTSFGAIKARYR